MNVGKKKSSRSKGLKINPEMWEDFFRKFRTPLFLEDATEVLAALAEVRAQGIQDISEWLDAHPEFITRIISLIKIVDVNDFAVEWSGARDKKELMSSMDRMVLPETLPAIKSILVDLFEGRTSHVSESQYMTLDGRHRYTWNQAHLPSAGDNPPLVVFSQSDITDLKMIQKNLQNSQDRYSRVVEAAQDVMLCHDLSGRITFINQAGLDLTGWTGNSSWPGTSYRCCPTINPMAPGGNRWPISARPGAAPSSKRSW